MEVARELKISARDLVRLSYWLCSAEGGAERQELRDDTDWYLRWQKEHPNRTIAMAEEGLLLLADDTECTAAALMNTLLSGAYLALRDTAKGAEYSRKNAAFMLRLPYSEELGYVFAFTVMHLIGLDRPLAEARVWLNHFQEMAEKANDLFGLAHAYLLEGSFLLGFSGDTRGAITSLKRALDAYLKTGNKSLTRLCLYYIGQRYCCLGDTEEAKEYIEQARQVEGYEQETMFPGRYYEFMGDVSFTEGRLKDAIEAHKQGAEVYKRHMPLMAGYEMIKLGRAHLAQGKKQEAVQDYLEAEPLIGIGLADIIPDAQVGFGDLLGGLEEAYDDPKAFQQYCGQFSDEHPELKDSLFVQWYLAPTTPTSYRQVLLKDEFAQRLEAGWRWEDRLGECSYETENGLEIRASNNCHLFGINWNAPRILRPIAEGFAAETVCRPCGDDRPCIGGVVIWKDESNYLYVVRGEFGRYDIAFMGSVNGRAALIGRGRLVSERVVLRLESDAGQVKALCSSDGKRWFTVGITEFPGEYPVEIGLCAFGGAAFERLIYHGAFPEGTAIRFESFALWGK